MTIQTQAAKRKEAERQRRKKEGKKRLELWAHPDDHAVIKQAASKLALKREKS